MGAYGYSIEQTLIVDVEPDSTVRRAMNEINAGQFTFDFSFVQFRSFRQPFCFSYYNFHNCAVLTLHLAYWILVGPVV